MKPRDFSARKLDVEAFARDGASLQGEWPAQQLQRLAEVAAPEAPAAGWPNVQWVLQGERVEPRAAEPQIWLHLRAQASAMMTCQRCLQAVEAQLQVERSFLFVRDEDQAAALDADSEDDVLALTRSLDAQELVEDELLLALPLVPRHAVCPQPLSHAADELPDAVDEKPNPFAALAALKGKAKS
jgi:uncharacterized protein